MLAPTASNWADLLFVASRVNSKKLLVDVRSFLRDHFDDVSDEATGEVKGRGDESNATDKTDNIIGKESDAIGKEDIQSRDFEDDKSENPSIISSLKENFPELLEEVLKDIKILRPPPPSSALTQIVQTNEEMTTAKAMEVPWGTLLSGVICVILYNIMLSVVAFGPIIPVINVLGVAGVFAYAYYYMSAGEF